ncbi:FkbM family methyltransferase [Rhodopila sp.]|uniref:FkbM family methyltransferase n=1 Tax=Rhodopila sp. TaxID=2480087 RepID=UPI003D12B217
MVATATRLLERVGYTLVPTWRLHDRALAQHLGKLLKQFEVDCVIDIGANDGGYVRFLRAEVGYDGLILSFEPLPALAAKCRAARDPHWQVFEYACGTEDSETEINVAAYSQFSSLLPTVASPPEAFTDMMTIRHRETVQLRRLDGLLPELQRLNGYKRPYLKVDTQGFDLAVLEGAGNLLEAMIAVQTELSFCPIYQGMPGWRTVLDVLEAKRFSVSSMFAISVDASLRAIEFDCILINDRYVTNT